MLHKNCLFKTSSQSQKNAIKTKGWLSKIWFPFALLLIFLYYHITGLRSMIMAFLSVTPFFFLSGSHKFFTDFFSLHTHISKILWQHDLFCRSTYWAFCYCKKMEIFLMLFHLFTMLLFQSKVCTYRYNTRTTSLVSFFYWLSVLWAYLGSKNSIPSQKNFSCNFLEALFGQSMNGLKRQ